LYRIHIGKIHEIFHGFLIDRVIYPEEKNILAGFNDLTGFPHGDIDIVLAKAGSNTAEGTGNVFIVDQN
jgi:hypothetical protein